MIASIEEQSGLLVLTNILATVWLGDWDRYEKIFEQMPSKMKGDFPFHAHYERESVTLWHENHFQIPGDYFISPYYSSYTNKKDGGEEGKSNLLCLIAMYEKLGFYYPLERNLYPDHIGCLTTFLGSILKEKIVASKEKDEELYDLLSNLEEEVVSKYINPLIKQMSQIRFDNIQHLFFENFLQFSSDIIQE
ncbi:molecular chaperone TorD family protein [Robertmurraya massiliosenegalensis]|uniref:molecular chaperone TorD family protein n=1 Tax=Robertmurraya massiliosenegalensis TaxID=1287657 RepID=UPI0002E3CF23|nr:molecular chaperone TorD family protein [Robertmurraya massiliosenegalensis]